MKIYIAGPYTADTADQRVKNVNTAIELGIQVLKKGHTPFIPHLTHYVDLYAKSRCIDITWEDYMAWDLDWLKTCDALLFIKESRGAIIELEYAKKIKLKIFTSIEEVPQEL